MRWKFAQLIHLVAEMVGRPAGSGIATEATGIATPHRELPASGQLAQWHALHLRIRSGQADDHFIGGIQQARRAAISDQDCMGRTGDDDVTQGDPPIVANGDGLSAYDIGPRNVIKLNEVFLRYVRAGQAKESTRGQPVANPWPRQAISVTPREDYQGEGIDGDELFDALLAFMLTTEVCAAQTDQTGGPIGRSIARAQGQAAGSAAIHARCQIAQRFIWVYAERRAIAQSQPGANDFRWGRLVHPEVQELGGGQRVAQYHRASEAKR